MVRCVPAVCMCALMFASVACERRTSPAPLLPLATKTQRDLDSEVVKQRVSDIAYEFEALKDHDWAGRYYEGDGVGANVAVYLAPKSGAVHTLHGCLGLYDQNHGSVEETKGRIRIAWKLPNPDDWNRPNEYLAVRWGERRYLIQPEDILQFCSDVRAGDEPRKRRHGMYLLRFGDEDLPVKGEPSLPPGFEKYLLITTIDARVKALGELSGPEVEEEGREVWTQLVTLDVGEAEGVLPNMVFKVTKPKDGPGWVVVRKVAERESEAAITFSHDKGAAATLPTTEWELSTPLW